MEEESILHGFIHGNQVLPGLNYPLYESPTYERAAHLLSYRHTYIHYVY